MSLDDIVSVSVTATTTNITRAGFGTPLIAAYHGHWLDRVRSYTSLSAMVTDGFSTTERAYQLAAAVFAQNPRPPRVKIGRRANAYTQVIELTPEFPVNGMVYTITIDDEEVTYTVSGSPTLAAVCTALASAINSATAGITASGASATKVVCTTDVAGSLKTYEDWTSTLSIKDATNDPGTIADLTAIRLADADWYGLVLDSSSQNELSAAIAWAASERVILIGQSADSAILDSGSTTDIAAVMQASAEERISIQYHPSIATEALAAGMLGALLPTDPGSETWAYKTITGVEVYTLTDSQKAAAHAKNAGTYTTIAGVNLTEQGKVASGQWIDVVRFIDWLTAQLQERTFLLLVANGGKLPYTDASVEAIKNEVRAVLNQGIQRGGLSADPVPTVFAPKVADVSAADRNARLLPDVEFNATLAGAIHKVTITGTVSA